MNSGPAQKRRAPPVGLYLFGLTDVVQFFGAMS